MDLPSHVLWTYALERVTAPNFVNSNLEFVLASLFFAALPDLLESTPFLIYLTLHRKKYNLKKLVSVYSFAIDINHNRQNEYDASFPWAAKISFYTHSFLLFILFALLLRSFSHWLSFSFLIGYGLHLFIDVFLHKDYFASKPLYPLSNFSIYGFITWYKTKNFSKYNYSLLFLTYLMLFWFR